MNLRRVKASRHAFTLVELMVVVVLIAIMTAMIAPAMQGTFEETLLRATSRKLVSAFGYASSRSITSSQSHHVRIDTNDGRFFVERTVQDAAMKRDTQREQNFPGSSGELDKRIRIELRRMDTEPEQAGRDSRAETAAKEPREGSPRDGTITFFPDGTADASEILLEDRQGFRLLLKINPVTARVRVAELERKGALGE